MSIITPERAGEIRGELTQKYGATWLHHYHEEIEAEVIRVYGKILFARSVRLSDALKAMLRSHEDACTGYGEGAADLARAAIAEAEAPVVQHLPSDDTEGGAL